ncbi:AlpA family phage regulatory protein [Novosphingobium sp. YJ-S2-02]|uniref:AlpA family phage regulatory protein n=1 Tax=Novosphingobium aureum TaxID=2792964 RepID=A0A931HD64_9SPHN|nr:AlpA family phage regulatory protein [Novosphingobium aureum]MBH0113278.1 AlpA family phage regulatory protein [Novosphingobium aureum]
MGNIEFWRLGKVVTVTGLSKSEIYRRMASGSFPEPKKYPDSKMNYWVSTQIIDWQRSIFGADEFDELLAQ